MDRGRLVIVGAGGLGVEALWVADSMNRAGTAAWEILGFADDNPEIRGRAVGGFDVLGTTDEIPRRLTGDVHFHVSIGRNRTREKVASRLEAQGWKAATLVHPSAIVGPGVAIGRGTYIGAATVVAPLAKLGSFVLVNCSAGVGHHAVLEDFVQICPGARVNGHCAVDKRGFIGSNASLNPGVRVGQDATVGSNSLVIRDVEPSVTVLGVPAKTISRPAKNESPG